jgi:hypothetical protein
VPTNIGQPVPTYIGHKAMPTHIGHMNEMAHTEGEELWINVSEAARLLRCSVSLIYRNPEALPTKRSGRRRYLRGADVVEFQKSRTLG